MFHDFTSRICSRALKSWSGLVQSALCFSLGLLLSFGFVWFQANFCSTVETFSCSFLLVPRKDAFAKRLWSFDCGSLHFLFGLSFVLFCCFLSFLFVRPSCLVLRLLVLLSKSVCARKEIFECLRVWRTRDCFFSLSSRFCIDSLFLFLFASWCSVFFC